MIKVMLIDDHPLFRAGVASTLSREPDFEVVGETGDGIEALETTLSLKPDVLLIDIRLGGQMNGVELARQIRERYPEVKLLVLTNYSHEPYVRAMVEIGVEGYILKDTPPHDVIESIRMVVDGQAVFSKRISQALMRGYLNALSNAELGSTEEITHREADVLRLLADGLSNAEIAKRLHISVGSVQFHLSSIYSKLGVRNRTKAIIQAARTGLVIIDE